MSIEIVMPKIGLNMQEGMIVEWVKKEGDPVKRGEVLFVLETDKVTVDSEAQENGVLAKILVPVNQRVPVKTPVAILVAEGEIYSGEATPATVVSSAAVPAVVETTPAMVAMSVSSNGKVLASPKAKHYAREHGIDLGQVLIGSGGVVKYAQVVAAAQGAPTAAGVQATPLARRIAKSEGLDLAKVTGSGTDGRITRSDVAQALRSQPAAVPVPVPMALEGVRGVIAERMLYSSQNTAAVTLNSDVDATSMVAYRQGLKAAGASILPSYNAILISLAAKALVAHPQMNARLQEGAIQYNDEINVGMAVDQADGLRVVVVRNADKKSVAQIQVDLVDLIDRLQRGHSLPDDFTGSTFTITNLGAFGIDNFTPIINPGETGILGIGRITEKLVIHKGKIAQRSMLTFSLTFDHQIIDGAPAARFLQAIAQQVETLE